MRSSRPSAGTGRSSRRWREAGVGKSRLFYEFKATSQSGCMVLEAFSVSHGKASAYLPVIDLLHNYFGIAHEDDERSGARRSREGPGARPALEDTLPYLFASARDRRGRRSARADGRADQAAAHARRDQADPAARSPQPAADRDLRGPALDRRARPRRCWICWPTRSAPRVLLLVNYRPEYRARVEQQDLLHAAPARPAGQGERRRDAGGAVGRRRSNWCRSSG